MRMNMFVAVASIVLVPYGSQAQERPRLPQGPAGTVTLPVADYDRLVDRAAQPETRPDPPPVPAVVSRADLRARVAADTARGTLRLDGETFERGLVKVLLVSGATLLEARADARPLPLLREGESHTAVLAGPAPFSLTLDWAAPITTAPGRASFALPAPAGGTIAATLDLPGDPEDVRVDPGIITRRQMTAGRTTLDVTLEPGRRTQVSWSVREAAAGTVPVVPRTLADIKSLFTIGDADLRLVSLVDISVIRGEPRTFEIRLPPGFELSSASGTSVETRAIRDGAVTFTVTDASRRRHQFLIALERPRADSSFRVDTSLPTVPGAQREVGEAAIEATGAVDVNASGDAELRRMDVRETHASLRALARQSILAAFRYQRRQSETRTLTLDVTRFADAPLLAAIAERAAATTLVTSEGRMLTEVQLTLRNRAQPFMKVTLPAGATMLSVDVAGETAKPVTGSDGIRVPLLRAGFRPDGPYTVSFVYLHAGAGFAKRGDARMVLPSLDVPISVLEWELFLPDRYSAKPSGGNVIPAHLPGDPSHASGYAGTVAGGVAGARQAAGSFQSRVIGPGQIVGRISDASGGAVPGARVTVRGPGGAEQAIVSDANGFYTAHGVPSGTVRVRGELAGFRTFEHSFVFDQRPRQLDFQLTLAGITETVTIQAEARVLDTGSPKLAVREEAQAPSQNVLNLQRRVAGVLPVRIDVPRTGTAFRFVRPLVLEEETAVIFKYKRR
jgi:hypothetical protein